MKTPTQPWTNGVERNRNHPKTFLIPSEEERRSVPVGAHVKIGTAGDSDGIPGEKFWAQVEQVLDGPRYVVRVDNDLVYTDYHGLVFNDRVEIEPDHILGTVVPHPLDNPNLRFFR